MHKAVLSMFSVMWQEKLMPTCMASIKLWPAAHAINFAFIPSSQRILYINVISVRSPALAAA